MVLHNVFAFVALLTILAMCLLNGAGCESMQSGDDDVMGMIPSDVTTIPNLIEHDEWSVDLIEVGPWYNRMPGVGNAQGRQHHLVATANIVNRTAEPITVEYLAGYISFDEQALGEPIPEGEFTIRDSTGNASGLTTMTVPSQTFKNMFGLRGIGLFGSGHDNEMLRLTLVLRINAEETIVLRRAGQVIVAM